MAVGWVAYWRKWRADSSNDGRTDDLNLTYSVDRAGPAKLPACWISPGSRTSTPCTIRECRPFQCPPKKAVLARSPGTGQRSPRAINRFRVSLGQFFVAKQEVIDLMTVAAVAQEPLLIVGPPGTAKSDLVLKFKDALGLAGEDYSNTC